MSGRVRRAGVIATVSGALLVVALLLDWWRRPAAFEHPDALPGAASFLAEGVNESGVELDADAFEFFEFRDIVWLAAGIAGFAFGLIALTAPRIATPAALVTAALGLGATVLIALVLIWPPDIADLGPKGARDVDLGVELRLSRDPGGFVALAAGLGITFAAALALVGRGPRSAA